MTVETYDVVVVGYGPTGMLAAIKFGRAGHRVAVLERYKTLYNLPRVGIVHDDVLRMFQEIEIWDDIRPATYFLPVYELANKGEVLLSNKVAPMATHGWPEMTSIYQPAFEAVLDQRAKALPSVDVFQGAKVTAIAQDDDSVTATIDEDGKTREVRGRYLIGADGGNSFVRDALGIGLEDLGFNQNWLVIDGTPKKPPRDELPLLRQFCEPEQPGMTMQMGPSHRRWSFQIFEGESSEDAVKPESVWRRLDRPEGATPDEFELIRVVSYKFQSLLADRWRDRRIFLAGDAAHQMPPFLAQGMCSGFRDGYNLAWKLDMVLSGKASDDFLDTYEAERGPNSRATVVESLRVGQNVNETDPEKVRARDDQLRAMQAEMEKNAGDKKLIGFRVPGFEKGFVCEVVDDAVKGAGDAFGQGRVSMDGNEGLFDDVAGRDFMVLSRAGDPAAALSEDDAAFWRALGGGFAEIGADALEDVEGVYTRMMDDYGCDVIVKRPDYYMFAACRGVGDLPVVIADIRRQLA